MRQSKLYFGVFLSVGRRKENEKRVENITEFDRSIGEIESKQFGALNW